MRKPAYKSAIVGLALGAATFLQPNYVEAQRATATQATQARENRILSKDSQYSGVGPILTDKIVDYALPHDAKHKLDDMFKLYAERGNITYEIVDARKGIEDAMKVMEAKSRSEGLSYVETQELANLEALLADTKPSDPTSLRLLQNAIKDGVIDPQADGLYLRDQDRFTIQGGTYVLVAKSPSVEGYAGKELRIPIRLNPWKARAPVVIPQDSIRAYIEEGRRMAKVDSVEKAKALEEADRIAREALKTDQEKKDRLSGVWLEGSYGAKGEAAIGLSFRDSKSSSIVLGAYGKWYALRGDPIYSETRSDTTARAKQLIGPGTYKERVDMRNTDEKQTNLGEAGAEFIYTLPKGIDLLFRTGGVLAKERKNIDGKAYIRHTRNDELLEAPSVIENGKQVENKYVPSYSLSGGFYCNFTESFSLGASYNRTGERNSVSLNAKYKLPF